MSKRRTHSNIDRLPDDLRAALMRMVVDNVWPDDWPGPCEGKPTYDDLVAYCTARGHVVSRSAVGRWAKRLAVYERMRTAGTIARDVMKGLSDEAATKTQKAAAEIITAQIIDFASSDEMSAKEIKSVATAIRDCTAVAMKADEYQRRRAKEKAAAAVEEISKIARKKQIDPEVLKLIREQVYGIVD